MDTDLLKEANDGNIEPMNVVYPEEIEEDANAGTPVWMTPSMPLQGDTSYYMPEGSAYQAFTPMPGGHTGMYKGAESPIPGSSPGGQTDLYP
jgi:hypothetical protein